MTETKKRALLDLLHAWGDAYMTGSSYHFHRAVGKELRLIRNRVLTIRETGLAKDYGYSDWYEAYAGHLTGYSEEAFLDDVISEGGFFGMTYNELRTRQQSEFNNFPCFYAFSERQFKEGLRRLDCKEKDLYRGPGGMFYRKADAGKLNTMLRRFDDEMQVAYRDDDFLRDAIQYELANHEYCITLDANETLEALGIEMDEVVSDKRLARIWFEAERAYLKGCD